MIWIPILVGIVLGLQMTRASNPGSVTWLILEYGALVFLLCRHAYPLAPPLDLESLTFMPLFFVVVVFFLFCLCDFVMCWLSRTGFLLVLYPVPRCFSSDTPVFPSPQNPTFSNSNSILECIGISKQAESTELLGGPWVNKLHTNYIHFASSRWATSFTLILNKIG